MHAHDSKATAQAESAQAETATAKTTVRQGSTQQIPLWAQAFPVQSGLHANRSDEQEGDEKTAFSSKRFVAPFSNEEQSASKRSFRQALGRPRVDRPRYYQTSPSRSPRNSAHVEESSAQRAVRHLASSLSDTTQLTRLLGNRALPPGIVGADISKTLEPYTGKLPADLILRTGPQIDQVLASRQARGLATEHEIWVGGPSLAPDPGGFATVFVHEAAHVASGASLAAVPPHFDGSDPLEGSWYEAAQRRRAELETAETGPGRQETIDRLASMSDQEARREAPGIAYRAQDRGDIELANSATERLLAAWLASRDAPATLTAGFGPEDAVDALLERAETAFREGHMELGGNYLSVVMVQLVRAAAAAVARRGPRGDDPTTAFLREAFLPMQRAQENEIFQRVQRARALLERHAEAVTTRGEAAEIAQFEVAAEAVHAAERQAGPPIAEDLGTGGVIDVPEQPRSRRRGRGPRPSVDVEEPPARPEETPQTPISRAEEAIVGSSHPDLEGALVFYSTSPPTRYGNIRSPRYGIAGTLTGAHRLAKELFGRRSALIAEDVHARDPATGARQVRYVIAALNTRITPPDPALGQGGQLVGFQDIEMLARPASPRYFFLVVASGDWQFFQPSLLNYVRRIRESEKGISQQSTLSEDERRSAVFGEIDRLIEEGETQEAANQLVYIGADGFALVDATSKTRYIVTMLEAVTFEAHERTIVEVFRAIAGQDELRAILHGIHSAGVLHNLHADLQSAFPSLLLTVGQRFGSQSLSTGEVRRLLSELGISRPLPGLEIRADGSIHLSADLVSNFVAAVEGLVNTISGAVTGIIDILLDPEAFIKGIAQLIYFGFMMQLANLGHPPAILYVSQVIDGIARQLGAATRGLSAIQQNLPSGVEFIRDLQRSVEWRIIWEVIGLFVGVGEAVALIDAIRGGRAAAGIAEVASGLSRFGRAAGLVEGAGSARLLRLATAVEGRAAAEAHILTVLRRLPEEEQARLARLTSQVDDIAELSADARSAVRSLRTDADTLAELQGHLGGDLSRATVLWNRLADAGLDGSSVRRLLTNLPEEAAVRGRALRAIGNVAEFPGANASMIEAIAGSTRRIEAVENLGAANYARLWNRAGGDATRADALLEALTAHRGEDPVAWQRTLESLRDPDAQIWRELEEATGLPPRTHGESAPTFRELEHGAALRRGADGKRRICVNPCAELEHLSLSDDVIDAAVRNIPEDLTDDLVETLAAFKGEADIPAVESLVTQLARGGEDATSAVDLLDRISDLRRIEGMQFELAELVAAHRRGDAILAHGPLQDPIFLEDILWGGRPAGPYEIHDGRLTFRDRPDLREHGLPRELRTIDFVILEGPGGAHRLVLGRNHSGLSGGRPWVFSAGEFRLSRSGEIAGISRRSGHYRPSPGNLARVREFLRDRGLLSRAGAELLEEF